MPCSFRCSGALALILFLAFTQLCLARIVINEIHYHPEPKTEPAEFIELYNTGPGPADLSGWRIADGVSYVIPNGTSLGQNQYLVIAQNPATILAKFSVSALGPWTGMLDNDGDTVTLLNASGGVEDSVEYQLGFPWPTVGDPPGYSIELINPNLDTSLGGSWRASIRGSPSQQTQVLITDHEAGWRCYPGYSEASSPTSAWRLLAFEDAGWIEGPGPAGYDGAIAMGIPLFDMRYSYTAFFLRKTFVVTEPTTVNTLKLEALFDDGFKAWINGTNVWNASMPAAEVPYNAVATGNTRESSAYDLFNLENPGIYLRPGTNILAVQVHNINLTNSSDCFFDCRLSAVSGPSDHGPTPGRLNSVYAPTAPPQIRQVDHAPSEPATAQPMKVTAKITDPDGVAAVTLQYQIVDPGNYISISNTDYSVYWIPVSMRDDGLDGDTHAGDSVYSVVLPGTMQQHRRLVRYRIQASDQGGSSITVPYPDDPQPNFAYFCYDGVPAWQAALRPGVTAVVTFETNVMRRLPSVHLIATRADVENGTWFSRYGGDAYPWPGTLVYDGKVYDHIHFRARGGVWRYAMVKNMWKFDLNRGHDLEMRDDYGKRFKTSWRKLNLGASIQQGDFGHRGEQGMFEAVGFRLFNLAGVASPRTSFLQFRVIDEADEAPADQYEGDFWGLYLGIEQEDGRFLDEHDLPDGNFYKMEGGSGELNNLGFLGPTDKSDLNSFLSTYRSTTTFPSEEWWRANCSLENYWSYQAIVQGIHHYDICYDKNYFYYRNPETGQWSVHTWDLDLTWANNMYDSGCGGIDDIYRPLLGGGAYPAKPALTIEYKNRVREIRDLLFNTDQAWKVIDEHVSLLRGPATANTFLDADRCMWDYNPKMINSAYSSTLSKAGQGRFYTWPNEPSVTKDFDGCIQLMKDYVIARGVILNTLATDPAIPSQPTLTYLGPADYALNRLAFQASPYSGANAFAAMNWRVAEVSDAGAPAYDPTAAQPYEIEAVWESGELNVWTSDMTLPSPALKVGHAYRTRVRVKDITGRWSRWSEPIQFVAGAPDNAAALTGNLRVTELMYHPPGNTDYEYIELRNTSSSLTLDLTGAKFTDGVEFTFPSGTQMPPFSYLLVAKTTNQAAFRAHYGLDASVPIAGPYEGSFANEGERVSLKVSSGGSDIASFDYVSGRGWPLGAKGAGHSLVPLPNALSEQTTGALDYPGNWRASSRIGGSPGRPDPAPQPDAVLLNEVTAHTDYFDPARPEYDSNDWLELINTTGSNVNLSNWFLSDDPQDLRKWPFPALSLPARGRIALDEVHDFHNPITSGFGIDKAGEQILLSFLPGTTEDRVVDSIQFKGQENGVSLGRYPDAAPWWFAMPRTTNAPNSAGLAGPVISEIMYHPADLGALDNTRDEFLELFNPAGTPIVLQDLNGVWRLDGGIGFSFPPGTTLPVGGTLLVVNFDPADAAALSTFRSVYGFTNTMVPILGPYSGKLGNRSDRIALERPQLPDLPGDPYSWIIVDEVIYGNQNPWPTNSNGWGMALRRAATTASGNDPANWLAEAPSPGAFGTTPLDSDGDGMPDSWEDSYNLNPYSPADASLDADLDGMSNLAEFLSGTDPLNASSALRFDSATLTSGSLVLRFTALANRSYTVQYKPNLAGSLWEKFLDVIPGPQRPVELFDSVPGQNQSRYYRLVTPATQ